MSIFVNPLQFHVESDLERYPRPFEQDSVKARAAGVDYLFAPSGEEMYPDGPPATAVHVAGITEVMEGVQRPGHFAGMATVVTKLLNIIGSCTAYFGEKDWQQLAVVRRMVRDLSFPVVVVGCPIVREHDGLALSSRNRYLDKDHRVAALGLYRALERGRATVLEGERNADYVREVMMSVMADEPLVEPSYAEVVGPDLVRPSEITGQVRLLVAAQVGSVRLIDNLGVVV